MRDRFPGDLLCATSYSRYVLSSLLPPAARILTDAFSSLPSVPPLFLARCLSLSLSTVVTRLKYTRIRRDPWTVVASETFPERGWLHREGGQKFNAANSRERAPTDASRSFALARSVAPHRDVCTSVDTVRTAALPRRESFTPSSRGAHKHVSPYLDACFRTNTKSIMRAVRDARQLLSLSLSLRLSSLLFSSLLLSSSRLSSRRGARELAGVVGVTRIHPFYSRGNTARWSMGAQRSMPPAGPSIPRPHRAYRSSWRQHPFRPHQDHRSILGGELGSRERGDSPFPADRCLPIAAAGRNS